MHVLPTVPSPTTTHLIGRPLDMMVTMLNQILETKSLVNVKCAKYCMEHLPHLIAKQSMHYAAGGGYYLRLLDSIILYHVK